MLLSELLQEFTFNCECRRLSAKTTENYRKQIQYLLDFLQDNYAVFNLGDVQAKYIQKFIVEKTQAGRKPSYVNDLLKAFKVCFKYAFEEGYTPELITEKIKNVKEPKVIIRTFSKAEIRRMLNCYTGLDFFDIRNRMILILFFETGIRYAELAGLTDAQIHDEYILIHGKGDKERIVPNTPIIAKWLHKYIRTRNNYFGSEHFNTLFVSRYNTRLSHSAISNIIKDAGEFAGVKDDIRVSAHTLRHTFSQQQLKNGLDIYSLSRILGHENIAITQRYLEGMRDEDIIKSAKTTSTIMNL